MIESGSLTPGVDPQAFDMPAGTALRYERPTAILQALLPSYAVLDSDLAVWKGPDSWALPGWPQIWIVLTEGKISVSVRKRRAEELGAAMVFGGSSCAMPMTAHGGASVVIDISPLGWARLFNASAKSTRDQIMPLDQLLAHGWANELIALLHNSNQGTEVKGILDDFFIRHLPSPGPDEENVARIHAAIGDETLASMEEMADHLAMDPRALRRFGTKYFGYPPIVLKRRTRFLRTLTTMMLAPDLPQFSQPSGYYDATHFIRDGNHFLGITPRRFMAMPMPYLRAALRARTIVIGQPLPLLDRVDNP